MNNEELKSFKFLKPKYRSGDQIIQPFCRTEFPQEIRSPPPLFDLLKLERSEKSTPESCRLKRNLMNDEEIRSLTLQNWYTEGGTK